jgi:hypothetical protein
LLLALNADAETLTMFWHLSKDDLHASTAILKLNVPGSTTLWLSWIWHNAHIWTGVFAEEIIGADDDAIGRVGECKCLVIVIVVHCTNINYNPARTLASILGSEK